MFFGQGAGKWWPRMPCSSYLCGFAGEMRRFHGSCFWCRFRRFKSGKMDPKKYYLNESMKCVLTRDPALMERRIIFMRKDPLDMRPGLIVYVLFIDKTRRLAKAKDVLLNKCIKIYEDTRPPRECLLVLPQQIRKRLLTLCEFLANQL
jgi:hypothetical protein